MKKIYLLWPTVRTQAFIDCHKDWLANADHPENIITKVAVVTEEQRQELLKYKPDMDVVVVVGNVRGVPYASYYLSHNLKANDSDLILEPADDMWSFKGWDTFLLKEFENYSGDIIYRDGIQMKSSLVTFPIMDYKTLKKLNMVIYNPMLHHNFADDLLYRNLDSLGLVKDMRLVSDVTFLHKHYINNGRPKDFVDDYANENAMNDKRIFEYYKNLPFEERNKPTLTFNKKLSVLICSMNRRKKYLDRLLARFEECKKLLDPINQDMFEILVETDDGQMSIGTKRNNLLDRALGEYICYVDDDDMVEPRYLELLLKAIDKGHPDCIGMRLLMITDNNPATQCNTFHSIKYQTWWHEPDPTNNGKLRYFRNSNHLNSVKRLYAQMTRFPSISMGEDRDYSMRLLPLLRSEINILPMIYTYHVRTNKAIGQDGLEIL